MPDNTPDPEFAFSLGEVERVGERLRAALRSALLCLPAESRGGTGLSAATGVERTTCQRIASALAKAESPTEVLRKLPGVRGLHLFADGLRAAGIDASEAIGLESAIREFDRLMGVCGGSKQAFENALQSGDGGALRAPAAHAAPRKFAVAQEEHFWSAAGLAGRWSNLGVSVQVLRPVPDKPELFEMAMGRGVMGHSARPSAVPLALMAGLRDADGEKEGPPRLIAVGNSSPQAGDRALGVVESLTSKPTPELAPRHGTYVMSFAVDPPDLGVDAPVDLVVGQRSAAPMRHPATHEVPVHVSLAQVDYPMRRLLFDVYLHRSMAMASIASLSTHLFGLHLDVWRDAWLTRLPFGPKLQLIGPWDDQARGDEFEPVLKTAAALFEDTGWDATDFVGFRCDVAYPIWRASYMMKFEFANEGEDRSAQ